MNNTILSLGVAGATLVVAFGALAFEAGIIADATGGVGAATPVHTAMLWVGLAVMLAALLLWILSKKIKR